VLVGIFGVAEEGKKLLGSHGPHVVVKLLACHRFLRGIECVAAFVGGQFNGPAAHFDRSAVILA